MKLDPNVKPGIDTMLSERTSYIITFVSSCHDKVVNFNRRIGQYIMNPVSSCGLTDKRNVYERQG